MQPASARGTGLALPPVLWTPVQWHLTPHSFYCKGNKARATVSLSEKEARRKTADPACSVDLLDYDWPQNTSYLM
jgi:hypothetical protein